jgi:hypothetical protein
MRVLKDYVHSFDFVRMRPDTSIVDAPAGLAVQALVETGRQYAVYLHAPVGAGGFAARWTGRLDPPASGSYRLTTESDDGVRVWLDGKLLIENWSDHAATEDHATVALVAGQPVDLKVEYYQGGGGATARLKWTRPDGTSEVVPADRLLRPDGSGPGLRGEYFEGRSFDEPEAVRVDAAIDFEWPPLPRPIARPAPRQPVEVALELPAGLYRAEWIDPKTGAVTKREDLEHAGGRKSLAPPSFDEDVALSVRARR